MRAFIGIKIKPVREIEEILEKIKSLDCGKTVEPENLHICLKFLGEIEEEKAEEVKKTMNELSGFGPFEISLKNIRAFPNENFVRVIWIGAESEEILKLQKTLDEMLQQIGFRKEKDSIPHITLARIKRKVSFDFFGERDFGTQKVEKICLVRSELGPKGPKYSDVYEVLL
jgi:2'-5' RNA ligase